MIVFEDHRGDISSLTKKQEGRVPALCAVKGKEALKESLQVGVLAFWSPAGHLLSRDLANLPLGHLK